MDSTLTSLTSLSSSPTSSFTASPTSSPSALPDPTPGGGEAGNGLNPAVSFIIGALIILAASGMNAAGLNITKLDHVRTSLLPRSSRRPQFLRPLWILGMALYITSQLLGSTLALQYLRAEYVAPLGSTSLIFNFLFASWLVGTPVTRTDVRGTIIVLLGVTGIVSFGSVHSSALSSQITLARLQYFWSRAAWWGFFLLMALGTFFTYTGSSILESVLHARGELELPTQSNSQPAAGLGSRSGPGVRPPNAPRSWLYYPAMAIAAWRTLTARVKTKVEALADASDERFLAWVLAMGWSCCGGALAGGCLVFAKACVSLFATPPGSGTPWVHPAALLTLLLLAITAVTQIVCLNRGLEAWDSTLVVPVFYGIYTCSGFLDSLIFYDEIPYYQVWVLIAIFLSIVVLVAGVILLSTKKPEKARTTPRGGSGSGTVPAQQRARERERVRSARRAAMGGGAGAGEEAPLRTGEAVDAEGEAEGEVMWELGEASDDEDAGSPASGAEEGKGSGSGSGRGKGGRVNGHGNGAAHGPGTGVGRGVGEGAGLMRAEQEQEQDALSSMPDLVAVGAGVDGNPWAAVAVGERPLGRVGRTPSPSPVPSPLVPPHSHSALSSSLSLIDGEADEFGEFAGAGAGAGGRGG